MKSPEDASRAAANKRRLGDFEVLRELGRGGMGVVYEARQVSLNRKVALKLLAASLGLTSKAVIRFKREAKAAAKLHHTNIVPIYATGEHEGTHYYAMELIEGPGLDQVIARLRGGEQAAPSPAEPQTRRADAEETAAPWAAEAIGFAPSNSHAASAAATSTSSLGPGGGYFDSIAKMIAEVADALDYAHAQGVVHRDIKPSNLLLSSDGRLHMNDFGLARMLEQPGMTVSGEFVGSPMYMSPEQIAVGRAPLDHRTDIYSLGATLYQLLTLEPPFQGERRDQVIGQIIHKEPRRPRSINRKIPVDLETICLKAMEKDPDKRYQTAGDMAKDLRAYVNRFAISARRVGPVGRALRWAKRHPAIGVAAALAFLAVIVAGAFALQLRAANARLLDQQRAAAIQDAVLASRAGDLAAAQEAINRAEVLHSSAGEIHMLRGQVALDQFHYSQARDELKQAARLLPDSVAVQGLLNLAYVGLLDARGAQEAFQAMNAHPPRTPEDFLYKGRAQHLSDDPALGLETISEGIRRGDSVQARMIRAEAQADYATITGDPADIHRALDDVTIARGMKPDNPAVLTMSLRIHTIAAGLFRWKGLTHEREEQLALAAQDYRALEPLKRSSNTKAAYWLELGDEAKAIQEWESTQGDDADWAMQFYVPVLYGQGNYQKALTLLEKNTDPRSSDAFLRVLILPELPDGAERTYKAWRAGRDEKLARWEAGMWLLPLQLIGRADEAVTRFAALRTTLQEMSRNQWYMRVADYEADALNEEQLLALAGNSQ